MEVKIQKVLSTGTAVPSDSGASLRIFTVVYDVIARNGGGIQLKRSGEPEPGPKVSLGTQDEQLLMLNQRFAWASVLRLFLQGFSHKESESDAILLGASDLMRLETLTDLVRQKGIESCSSLPGAVCLGLPRGSASLFSIVWPKRSSNCLTIWDIACLSGISFAPATTSESAGIC